MVIAPGAHRRRTGSALTRTFATVAATIALASLLVACSGGDLELVRVGPPPVPTSMPVTATGRPVPTPVPATPTDRPSTGGSMGSGLAPIGVTELARVLRVIDGDTIEVDRGRGAEDVRYIGVDTPETVHPTKPVEWMGKEASAANHALVEGRTVILERDLSDSDRYGRLLRYVWVEDGSSAGGLLFVNLELVARGFAQVVTYPPDVRWVDRYLEAQSAAREQGLGLWGTPPAGTVVDGGGTKAAGGCDPSYPDVCIPPPPPDLDCGDIPYHDFRVLPPDPHRFDGGGDGRGCEG